MMARRVLGFGCLTGGLLSAAAGITLGTQNEPWSGPMPHPGDVERSIGPLTDFIWIHAARLGIVALVLSAVLFAAAYWLLGPPRRGV